MDYVFINNDWTPDVKRCEAYASELSASDLDWSFEVVTTEANGLTLCQVRITDEEGEIVAEGYPSFKEETK
tara:strand:- start:75 stop:287 length:213 start_codon:yes stop_codon:yes gene_type:complete